MDTRSNIIPFAALRTHRFCFWITTKKINMVEQIPVIDVSPAS